MNQISHFESSTYEISEGEIGSLVRGFLRPGLNAIPADSDARREKNGLRLAPDCLGLKAQPKPNAYTGVVPDALTLSCQA
jgi:hypothetical protein